LIYETIQLPRNSARVNWTQEHTMSHEISIRSNGFVEMAFAGELPWHELGNRVNPDASIEEWQQQAGLDWTVETATVQYRAAEALRSFDDRRVLYRSDTNAPLSVVSDGYQIVQPKAVLEFFRDLTTSHGFKIHTAGVLKGGRKIWALAKNGHVEEAAPGDKLRGNLLLATSCDGTMATQALWTAIRVVCANTLRIAVDGARDAIKTNHKSVFDADATKREMGALDDSFAAFAKTAQQLVAKHISDGTANAILNQLFVRQAQRAAPVRAIEPSIEGPATFAQLLAAPAKIGENVKEHRAVGKIMTLFQGAGLGANHAGSVGTAWGLVNAVSEYVDHQSGRSADNRVNSAWFGQGAEVKQQAIELALAA
jgi:phage/plasmid-like protein (TIGR03299 family)